MTDQGKWGFMLKNPRTLDWIRRLFANPRYRVVFHNAKFDLKMFLYEGIDIYSAKCQFHCTLVMSKLIQELGEHNLEYLGVRYLSRDTSDKRGVPEWLKENGHAFRKEHGRAPNYKDCPLPIVKARAVWDVTTTIMLDKYFMTRIQRLPCARVYDNERQLLLACIDMEKRGVRVDLTRATELRHESLQGMTTIKRTLTSLICPLVVPKTKKCKCVRTGNTVDCDTCDGTGRKPTPITVTEFNAGSSAQMEAAFRKLGIELRYKTVPKKKKNGKMSGGGRWAFNEYAMIRYAPAPLRALMKEASEDGWGWHKFYAAIIKMVNDRVILRRDMLFALSLRFREVKKMVSTYYDAILNKSINHEVVGGRKYGILHCSFNPSEAITGRFSCSDPNLQNIPRIMGPRECFVPRRGYRNWHLDYEQIEMRFFAHFARDPFMAKAIEGDIHEEVAAEIYRLPRSKVSKEQRKRAKGVNFGVIYGAGGDKIAETLTEKGLDTTKGEGRTLVASYHRRFPSVRKLSSALSNQLIRQGYVANEYGRMYHIRTKHAYKAINAIVQGQSADEMKFAMLRVWKWLRNWQAKGGKSYMIMTIHDELVFEIPDSEAPRVVPVLRKMMENLKHYFVPIKVGIDVTTERWSKKQDPEELKFTFAKAA